MQASPQLIFIYILINSSFSPHDFEEALSESGMNIMIGDTSLDKVKRHFLVMFLTETAGSLIMSYMLSRLVLEGWEASADSYLCYRFGYYSQELMNMDITHIILSRKSSGIKVCVLQEKLFNRFMGNFRAKIRLIFKIIPRA